MATRRREVLQRISPGETDMCVLGMPFHAITGHSGDKTCQWIVAEAAERQINKAKLVLGT